MADPRLAQTQAILRKHRDAARRFKEYADDAVYAAELRELILAALKVLRSPANPLRERRELGP